MDRIQCGKGKELRQGQQPETQAQLPDVSEGGKKRRRGPSISTIIIVAFMVVGAAVLAYPTFSDWWNSYHQTRAISTYVAAVDEADPQKIQDMLDAAHAYNQRLLTKPNRFVLSDEEKREYESILDLTGSGVIGYIQVPSIGVNLPVYHGVSESVLQVAIGHIEGSSLPVGGENTHAAVSGHRGLPSARLFTDLDKLVEGDLFTITVLDQTATYEIDQIRIVDPSDMSDLNIAAGKDYATLITCTPYGINTHRMLVRGHRTDGTSDAVPIPAEAVQIPSYIAVPAVAVPMLFAYLLGTLLYYHFKRPELDKEGMLAAVRDKIGKGASDAGDPPAEWVDEPQADELMALESQADEAHGEEAVAGESQSDEATADALEVDEAVAEEPRADEAMAEELRTEDEPARGDSLADEDDMDDGEPSPMDDKEDAHE